MCGIGGMQFKGLDKMAKMQNVDASMGAQPPKKPQGGNSLQIGNLLSGVQGMQDMSKFGPLKEGDPQ